MLLSISMLYLAPVTSPPPPVFSSVSPHTERLQIDPLPTELGWNNTRTNSSDLNCNKWLAVSGWDPDFRRFVTCHRCRCCFVSAYDQRLETGQCLKRAGGAIVLQHT